LSNERLIYCTRCGKRLLSADESRAVADPAGERRRVRLLYAWLAVWVIVLVGAVVYTVGYDPTAGHIGRVVYGDETLLETAGRDASNRLIPGNQTFRLSRSDHVERMKNLTTRSPRNAWIRITSGPHAGRTGVIVW
jgi:hypothetical protein